MRRPRKRNKYVGVVVPSEHQEQAVLFAELERRLVDCPELGLAYAIPNGTRATMRTAKKMKAEGVKKGIPDIHLPVGRDGYLGLYVELKARPYTNEKGRLVRQRPSREQLSWMRLLEEQGYKAEICEGWEQALGAILRYVRSKPTKVCCTSRRQKGGDSDSGSLTHN